MDNVKRKIPFGLIPISVIMVFAALATFIFWMGKFFFDAFPQTLPVEPLLYNSFAIPDLVLSVLLIISGIGLVSLKNFGYLTTFIAMGMWLFDLLLVTALTKGSRLSIVLPFLAFCLYTLFYLWKKKELFT